MKTTLPILLALALTLARAHGQNPVETELFPPDFLFSHREALNLDEAQAQSIQEVMQEVQPKLEANKAAVESQMAALREELKRKMSDPAQAEAKLKALLQIETEMKMLQFQALLKLRDKLTPAQLDKARELREEQKPPAGSAESNQALKQRLQAKFEQLKAAVQSRAAGGEPPQGAMEEATQIRKLVEEGQPGEAEQRIDALLARLRGEKPAQ